MKKKKYSHTKNLAFLMICSIFLCIISGVDALHASSITSISKPKTEITIPTISNVDRHYPVNQITNIHYGNDSKQILDECIPENANTNRSGVIYIHGGGWVSGDKSVFSDYCNFLASNGFVVANIDYRLALQSPWPAQINDAQLAVRYIRAHSTTLHINPNSICSMGDSAGGQLSLLLDEMSIIHQGDTQNIYPKVSPKTNCAIDEFGPTDLSRLYYEDLSIASPIVSALANNQDPTHAPTLYADASPVSHISSKTSPVLIIQGNADILVPKDQSDELKRKLASYHIPMQYILFPGGHEFAGLNMQDRNAINNQIISFLSRME